MIPIHLAVEDELSEQVVRRLLVESNRPFHVSSVISRGGYGYLKSKISGINKSAKALSFFVLTDLDNCICASGLIQEWLPTPQNPNLIFRVAVREVEAWLLGDRNNFAKFLGIPVDTLPTAPESLSDPKSALLQLASKAGKAAIRRRLLHSQTKTARQGPEYNSCLTEYVAKYWNPEILSQQCPSLAKCRERISKFQPTAAYKPLK